MKKIINKFIFILALLFSVVVSGNSKAEDFSLVCSGQDNLISNYGPINTNWQAEYLISTFPSDSHKRNRIYLIRGVNESISAGRFGSYYTSLKMQKTVYPDVNIRSYTFNISKGIIEISTDYSYNDSYGLVTADYDFVLSLRTGLLNIKGNLNNEGNYTTTAKCSGYEKVFSHLNKSISYKKTDSKKKNSDIDYKQYWWVVILVGAIAFFVYMQTSKDLPKNKKQNNNRIKKENIILKFYRGKISLAVSFWLVYVLAGSSLSLILYAIPENGKNDLLIIILSLFAISYSVFAMIGSWKSASNYKIEKQKKNEKGGWGTAAQVYIFLSAIRIFVELVRGLN